MTKLVTPHLKMTAPSAPAFSAVSTSAVISDAGNLDVSSSDLYPCSPAQTFAPFECFTNHLVVSLIQDVVFL